MQDLLVLHSQVSRVRQIIVLILKEVRLLDAEVNQVLEQSEFLQNMSLNDKSEECLEQAEMLYEQISELYDIEQRLSHFLEALGQMNIEQLTEAEPLVEDFKVIFEHMLKEKQIGEAVELFNQCSSQFLLACVQVEADSSD